MANYFTDRVVQYPGRVTMTPTGNTNEYDLARSEGNVTAEGTPFNAAKFNEIANTIHAYGTCTSAAGASTKVVTCPGFVLNAGATITVLFSNHNSATGTIYLNVNGTGAKQIRRVADSGFSDTEGAWNSNMAVTFVYTGTYWLLITDNRPLRTQDVTLPTKSISANAFGTLTATITVPDGYEAVGVVSVVLNASGALILYFTINSGTELVVGCRNVTGSAVNQSGRATVLFQPISV